MKPPKLPIFHAGQERRRVEALAGNLLPFLLVSLRLGRVPRLALQIRVAHVPRRRPRQLKWYTPDGEREIVDAQCLKGRLVPEDVGALFTFLASDDARLINGHEYSWKRGGDEMTVLSKPENLWSVDAELGEGPVWVDGALWFVDIKKRKVHRYLPDGGERRSWDSPQQIGFLLPSDSGGFVAGLQSGLHRFDPAGGEFTLLAEVEPDLAGNRLNDGVVDPSGRLWFGSMDNGESEATGRFYSYSRGRLADAGLPKIAITNGPAVSPDGRILYWVDTLGGTIHACDVAEDATLGEARLFAEIAKGEGFPDGPTVDSEGCVWISLYWGWEARRYSPEGKLIERVGFPVSNITKIAFGGQDLRTVYATTARQGIKPEAMDKQQEAGALFAFEVDVPGLPSPRASL